MTPATPLEQAVMDKIRNRRVVMKPKWYFVLGSILMTLSVAGVSIVLVFVVNLFLFLIRRHGPMGQWRLEQMLSTFPWWLPLLALVGVGVSIWLFRQYEFSYKKNFTWVVIGFLASIIVAAFVLEYSGISDTWIKKGPMRRYYQELDSRPGLNRGKSRMRGYPSNQPIHFDVQVPIRKPI